MTPRFTIAIPAYKTIYFEECLKSVLCQDYPYFELIILNDCSPNPVDEIVHRFRDDRIRYYKNEAHAGGLNLVLNWNKCVQLANEEFIIIMGDDDLMEPGYLSEFSRMIEKYPDYDIYHCRTKIIDEDGSILEVTPKCTEVESVYDQIWQRMICNRPQYITDFVYRKEKLLERGGFYFLPYAWGSDDISGYLVSGTKGIVNSNNAVFQYRRSRFTITNNDDTPKKIEATCGLESWFHDFLMKEPVDENDRITYQTLKKEIWKTIQKRKINLIADDLKNSNPVRMLFWLRRRQKYRISLRDILYASSQFLFHCIKKSKG
jgi:glycosyltransferase involved in cell wall biosynthesis